MSSLQLKRLRCLDLHNTGVMSPHVLQKMRNMKYLGEQNCFLSQLAQLTCGGFGCPGSRHGNRMGHVMDIKEIVKFLHILAKVTEFKLTGYNYCTFESNDMNFYNSNWQQSQVQIQFITSNNQHVLMTEHLTTC